MLTISELENKLEKLSPIELGLFKYFVQEISNISTLTNNTVAGRLNNDIVFTYNNNIYTIKIRDIEIPIHKRDIKLVANGLNVYIDNLIKIKLGLLHAPATLIEEIEQAIGVNDKTIVVSHEPSEEEKKKIEEQLQTFNQSRVEADSRVLNTISFSVTIGEILEQEQHIMAKFIPLSIYIEIAKYMLTHDLIRLKTLRKQIEEFLECYDKHEYTLDKASQFRFKIGTVFRSQRKNLQDLDILQKHLSRILSPDIKYAIEHIDSDETATNIALYLNELTDRLDVEIPEEILEDIREE